MIFIASAISQSIMLSLWLALTFEVKFLQLNFPNKMRTHVNTQLVGGFKMVSSSPGRDQSKKIFELPPSPIESAVDRSQ